MRWKIEYIAAALSIVLGVTLALPLENPTQRNTEYRLPTNVIPLEYKIELDPLQPSVDDPTYFDGTVTIKVHVIESTDTITLHAHQLEIKTHKVTLYDDDTVIETEDDSDATYQFYIIKKTEGVFEEEKDYLITITYKGYHSDSMSGFYRSSYKDEDGVTRWLVTTQFQATSARRAFPCFDEPALKATFDIIIKKKPGLGAISNMNIASDDDDEWYYFATTPKMSTYLVAFIVSDFESQSDDGTLKVWARKQYIDQTAYSIEIGQQTLDKMAEFLMGNEYTLPKMDEAAIPDFSAGAMENWGLCTYRERLLLYDKRGSNAQHKQSIATIVAHEFAHQWFGNLVSPEWWNYLWINEGFATYFESYGTALVETTWRLEEQFVVRYVQPALAADALESTRPMTQDVGSPSSISASFDTVAYSKAGSVIRMMEHFVTTDVFRSGLKRFLEARNHNYANEDHLYDAMTEELGNEDFEEDVKEVMYTWTRQAGHPVLDITADGQNLEISQKRFLLVNPQRSRVDTLWTIPLTYVGQDGDFSDTKTKQWMKEATISISRPSDVDKWYLFNVQQAGFYRVNYDSENWKLLIDYLHSDEYEKIHPVNRAHLLDDALMLARAGELDYETALSLTRYLQQETDYIPWYAALNNLVFLRRRLTGTSDFENFKNYILKLIDNIYNELKFEDSDDHSHVTKLHRHLILTWACELDHEHCVQTSKEKFNAFRTRSEEIPADLQSVVFCTAVRHGGKEEFDHLWNLYLSTNFATQQNLILSALGCTKQQDLVNDYLTKSITAGGDIRRQDASSVFAAVYANPESVELAMTFLEEEFEAINNFYGSVSSIISGIAARISTQELIDRLENFVLSNDLGSAGERAVEAAKDNLYWMQHYEETIGNWLKNEAVTDSPSTSDETSSSDSESTSPSEKTSTDGSNSVNINPFVYIVFLIHVIFTYIKHQL